MWIRFILSAINIWYGKVTRYKRSLLLECLVYKQRFSLPSIGQREIGTAYRISSFYPCYALKFVLKDCVVWKEIFVKFVASNFTVPILYIIFILMSQKGRKRVYNRSLYNLYCKHYSMSKKINYSLRIFRKDWVIFSKTRFEF